HSRSVALFWSVMVVIALARAGPGRGLRPPGAVAASQLHVDAEVAVEIGLGAVEIEITDGQAAQVAADARVDGFADDPVHAGKRADVDNAGRALLGEVDHFADVEHHFPKGAFARQVRARALQNFVDIGLF